MSGLDIEFSRNRPENLETVLSYREYDGEATSAIDWSTPAKQAGLKLGLLALGENRFETVRTDHKVESQVMDSGDPRIDMLVRSTPQDTYVRLLGFETSRSTDELRELTKKMYNLASTVIWPKQPEPIKRNWLMSRLRFSKASVTDDESSQLPFNIRRVNNWIPNIIDADGIGRERYREFNGGRDDGDWHRRKSGLFTPAEGPPAASGLGTQGGPLAIEFFLTRATTKNIENPNQMRADMYDRSIYGDPPNFARATLVEEDGGATLWVSGTSSITGQRTMYANNAVAQTELACRNVSTLISTNNVFNYGPYELMDEPVIGNSLENIPNQRWHIRHESDYSEVKERLLKFLGKSALETPTIYLRGDICRPDLRIEVEINGIKYYVIG